MKGQIFLYSKAFLQVVLRGTGTKHDSDSLLRKRVEQGLSNATSRRESALVIERILRDLTVPPARPQKIPEALMKDHNMFAAAASSGVAAFSSVNGEVSETRRPLFWNEGLGTRLHAAFDQLKELVTPVRQETPPGGTGCNTATVNYECSPHLPVEACTDTASVLYVSAI